MGRATQAPFKNISSRKSITLAGHKGNSGYHPTLAPQFQHSVGDLCNMCYCAIFCSEGFLSLQAHYFTLNKLFAFCFAFCSLPYGRSSRWSQVNSPSEQLHLNLVPKRRGKGIFLVSFTDWLILLRLTQSSAVEVPAKPHYFPVIFP